LSTLRRDRHRPGSFPLGARSVERAAGAPHRARGTHRSARAADERAEIHDRLIEVVGAPRRQRRLRQRPQARGAPATSAGPEHAREDARGVGIENRGILPERERGDGAGGIAADPGELS
jgi:hypothetical protein